MYDVTYVYLSYYYLGHWWIELPIVFYNRSLAPCVQIRNSTLFFPIHGPLLSRLTL